MGISDQQTLQKFPFPYEQVFDNILTVLAQEGFSVKESDKIIGRVVASTGMSMFSYGENISISLDRIDESTTSVNIVSGLKVSFNIGSNFKNQKNIDKLFMSLSKSLQKEALINSVDLSGRHSLVFDSQNRTNCPKCNTFQKLDDKELELLTFKCADCNSEVYFTLQK